MHAHHLSLDFETRSEIDLKQRALDVYARHESTRPLMLGYAVDNGPAFLWEPHKSEMPSKLRAALTDPRFLKTAFNATFERAIFKHTLGIDSPIEQWLDTMVMANTMALPGSLWELGQVLKLGPEFQKDARGKTLIQRFCKPNTITKARPWAWSDWTNCPGEWDEFGEYCKQDVISERRAFQLLSRYLVLPEEWDMWRLDQKINETGCYIDMELVNEAVAIAERVKKVYTRQMREISGLKNPSSVAQLLPWLEKRGYPFSELRKERVALALQDFKDKMDPEAVSMLELRLKAEKSSLKKYVAMQRATADDRRLRYTFQFSGAGRTGRWAGRVTQLQNLPRPKKEVEKHLDTARDLIRDGSDDLLWALFDNPLDVLTSSIRSAIHAPQGHKLVIADLSAIESRVIGWIANCQSLLDVFRSGRDTYKTFAVHLFNKAYEDITKDERNQAKPAVLGAGYRLGGGDIVGDYPDQKKTGLWAYAESMGIKMTRDDAHRAVQIFRTVYPEIVQLWYDLENAVSRVMAGDGPQRVGVVLFELRAPFLTIRLPSGRRLYYCRPKMEQLKRTGQDGKPYTKLALTYEGIHQTSKKWVRMPTHGGKLVENIVQAVANDILRHGLTKAHEAGFKIVAHVHDEIVAEVPLHHPELTVHRLEACMTDQPAWAKGLPLGAEGFETLFYKKG